ncbi:unnamed protein product [Ectocarpus sp. CCAP 1310/34]|nr:unnamed protein product [Ectocarpus sp. CCAP 1310/34]
MEKGSFHKLVGLLRPSLEVNAFFGALRSPRNGAIAVEVRVAVALRILAGASYWDVLLMFGLSVAVTYQILWEVIDAINNTPAVGAFDFPLTEEGCMRNANRFKEKSTDGIFSWVVAAVDGLFIKAKAPYAKDTANVLAYYSGSKSAYGINVPAMCTADYRFCAMSAISPGSTNDWVAWNRSSLAKAVARFPAGIHIIGDAAYPIGEKLLTPYPGRQLPAGEDSFNSHLSQLLVKIEQSFGILVSTWGILWRPLRMQVGGRADLIIALFHLHNFLQDEKVAPIQLSEEDSRSGLNRPAICATQRTLPDGWGTEPAPSRSGETPARAAIRKALELKKQWRRDFNLQRNS